MAKKTFETSRDLKFEPLEYPPYSLDHVPSYFHMFGSLKDAITGVHISNNEEEINKVYVLVLISP